MFAFHEKELDTFKTPCVGADEWIQTEECRNEARKRVLKVFYFRSHGDLVVFV